VARQSWQNSKTYYKFISAPVKKAPAKKESSSEDDSSDDEKASKVKKAGMYVTFCFVTHMLYFLYQRFIGYTK